MASIHFIGGEKGGVGKSLTTRLLAQYFIDRELDFAGFDTDQSHRTFSRFYADYTTALDMEAYESLDQIIETAEAQPDTHILVDLAAQTDRHLQQWLDEGDVFGIFAEFGRPCFLWHVMDDGADSVFLLEKLLARKPDSAQVVVVLNKGRGEYFGGFEQSAAYQQALQQGALFIALEKLHPALMQKIDFGQFSFWAAGNNRETMGIADRKRVEVWLKRAYRQFDNLPGFPAPATDGMV